MRLLAPDEVIARAEDALDAIVSAYLGPNLTLHDMLEYAHDGGLDPLRQFSEACRTELEPFSGA